jgi:hypothetical protein
LKDEILEKILIKKLAKAKKKKKTTTTKEWG